MADGRTTRPRLWLLISCGWSVRNYLRSDFLERMCPHADVNVWLPEGSPRLEDELRKAGIGLERLRPVVLPRRLAWLNGLLVQADNHRLGYWDPHFWSWLLALQPPWKRPYLLIQQILAKGMGPTSLYPRLRRLEQRWLEQTFGESPDGVAAGLSRPDLILSTNPYNLEELPISLMARRTGIPVMAAIVSWDNLCYKGHLWSDFDEYIVWGPAMHEDLRRHFSALPEDRIKEAGSPQFDFHLRRDLRWTREEFFRRIGGDPGRPLITYAANVEWLFPDEPAVVAGLWNRIRNGAVSRQPQLLIRLHPHDTSTRFEGVLSENQGLLLQRSSASRDHRHWWFTPSVDDLAVLANTLRYSDVTANMSSSMTLDAAVLDRPVVNVAFSTTPENPRCRRIPYNHLTPHYRKVAESGAVKIAYSMEEFVRWINRYLADPSREREERRAVVRAICGPADGGSIERIADALARWMGVSPAPDGKRNPAARPWEGPV